MDDEPFSELAALPPEDGPHGEDVRLAHRIADIAGRIALAHQGAPGTRWKADGSPVTLADLEIDDAVHEVLRGERPDDGILSEEHPERPGTNGRRWIIDPLDGTSLYAYGDPGWATLIALEDHGDLVVGLASFPEERRRYWTSATGTQRALAGRDGLTVAPARVSTVSDLSRARTTAWQRTDLPDVARLRSVTRWQRPDQFFLPRLLDGELDVLYSTGGEVWDHAASVALVVGAGGRFRDHEGGCRIDLRGGLYTNGVLEEAVLERLDRSS